MSILQIIRVIIYPFCSSFLKLHQKFAYQLIYVRKAKTPFSILVHQEFHVGRSRNARLVLCQLSFYRLQTVPKSIRIFLTSLKNLSAAML